jgi:multiubiquitin
MSSSTSNRASYQVCINGQLFLVSEPTISGAQVRALAGLNDQDIVVKEEAGTTADRLIADDEQVTLESGAVAYFYTSPPTMFG